MKKIKIGVIGCGVIAPTHVESYQRLPNAEVSWACDLDEARAAKLAAKYGIPHTATDASAVFADPDVDAVSICTPHASHVQLCIDAMAAGKDVLCEKALAATPEGLRKIRAAAERHPDRIFSAVFQHRFSPVMQYVRDAIAAGKFGRMVTASMQHRCMRTNEYYTQDNWRGTWANEGGSALINQSIHFLDLFQWLMGGISDVRGFYANLSHGGVIETEDTIVGAVRFKDGALGTIESTTSSNLWWEPILQFHGTDGCIELDDESVRRIETKDPAVAAKIADDMKNLRTAPPTAAGKAYYGNGHAAQIEDFVNSVRTRERPFVTVQDAYETVRVVFAMYEAARAAN